MKTMQRRGGATRKDMRRHRRNRRVAKVRARNRTKLMKLATLIVKSGIFEQTAQTEPQRTRTAEVLARCDDIAAGLYVPCCGTYHSFS